MTRTACIMLLLAACSGGGGGSSPSSDLSVTHPMLLTGGWAGAAISVNATLPIGIDNAVFEPTADPAVAAWTLHLVSSSCFSTISGTLRASGSTVTIESPELSVTAILSQTATTYHLTGPYRINAGACAGDSGTFVLDRLINWQPRVTLQDHYGYPDLDVFVLVERR